ncbi:MAG: phage holin family protein [Dehalococcoidales bacterium]|nr:phage holin family protein [Dehalococcoidales bacterium]
MSEKPGIIARLLIRFIINAAAIVVATQLISGIHLDGWKAIVFVTIIFGLVNALIRPLVLLVTCFIQVLTLGLFTLVINGAMLYFTAWLAGIFGLSFSIDNFLSAFLGALVVGVVSFILSRVLK